MELTEEEIKIIVDKRNRDAEIKIKQQRVVDLLELSARYKKYLNRSGMGETYSDFCSCMGHDYGELDYIGLQGNQIYNTVCLLINTCENEFR
jgi:hypothetical protein